MNKLCLLILLTACSHANQTKIETINMNGTIHISLEESEFIYNEQTYYLNDELGILDPIIQDERKNNHNSFNIKKNICLNGYIKTKEQNKNNGFGALGKYSQAIFIKSRCENAK